MYHHAEPKYLMLLYWIPKTINPIPANASHIARVGAIVLNDKREVYCIITPTFYISSFVCFAVMVLYLIKSPHLFYYSDTPLNESFACFSSLDHLTYGFIHYFFYTTTTEMIHVVEF